MTGKIEIFTRWGPVWAKCYKQQGFISYPFWVWKIYDEKCLDVSIKNEPSHQQMEELLFNVLLHERVASIALCAIRNNEITNAKCDWKDLILKIIEKVEKYEFKKGEIEVIRKLMKTKKEGDEEWFLKR